MMLFATSAGCFALFSLDDYGPASAVTDDSGPGDVVTSDVIADVRQDTGPLTGKIAFVTKNEYRVDKGDANVIISPSRADTLCQKAAAVGGLGGTFYAWFSDGNVSPSEKFAALVKDAAAPAQPTQIITTDNQLIASNFDELLASGPRVAIRATEMGTALPTAPPANKDECPDGGLVWTGTTPAGTSDPGNSASPTTNANCFDWQANNASASARAGRIVKDPKEWTSSCYLLCSGVAHLYCFQQ